MAVISTFFAKVGAAILAGSLLWLVYVGLKSSGDLTSSSWSIRGLQGVDLHGRTWPGISGDCHIIRITQDSCTYCKRDSTRYGSLVDHARQRSCGVVEVAPLAGSMAVHDRHGVTQLKYISREIGGPLIPIVTPQTVIVDKDGKLMWMRRGAFTDASLNAAISAVDKVAGH